ncbi:MAG: 16S rRNA (adenine(1518)-N(6)/adenine(1519)-N(6))-dimethyltransferase RsmA [Xanthomonadales bacterium]|nr:16S rRNA (adenine(1518)-N(6)/adenine(1519)-N(6))-dimethyltransferase RsmA [Xanthomonadales bacterium]NIN58604.1 16S rRNA (adenine(1518)-N(6)/adenine(1519)-N(6))-dimethyltransferase RsmA [Xanthomonadales bacterium]NIN73893.1 16S rRNA (adenine(1518)-N(6)/adenine(1519)-N(6))-dimethyltransferase RsmA [Xanthomonadales bacterium]NIO12362.1 16S rRNA (adenine(1518)-N(6)/adenine(1519)-N(6))-dimethyltransferase RsmA [Xanthomonadales bacterium]NIP10997.1 16S rRNA (adenine(1518)-N(6)/adenine(1519)-N(6))
MNHRPRRRFSQNFLVDHAVIDRMVAAIDPQPGQLFIEIGPGRGALTLPVLAAGAQLCAIEIDRDLAAALERTAAAAGRLQVVCADALGEDFAARAGDRPFRLLGNLPYHISTPLLFHALAQRPPPQDIHFLLQQEVVERLAAEPGGREYGRLSVSCQNLCRVTPLFTVGPQAFQPEPAVDSAFVRLEPRAEPISGHALQARLEQVVRAGFAQRRKTLRNSLGRLLEPGQIQRAGVDPGLRAEQLRLEDFIALAARLPAARSDAG